MTDKDKEGQTKTGRDREGQGGTDNDKEGQTRTSRGIQGHGGPLRLVDYRQGKEGQTRTRRVV